MTMPIARSDVAKFVSESVSLRAATIRLRFDSIIPKILEYYRVDSHFPSDILLNEVAFNCAKDLEKIAIYQEDQVDELKTIGYFGFWIRKIKPIEQATRGGKAFKEVNEYLSIWVIVSLLSRYYVKKMALDKNYREKARVGIFALTRLVQDKKRLEYLVHCMRSRTFGPHHYVIMLQQITEAETLI